LSGRNFRASPVPVDKLNALPGLELELSSSWMEEQGGTEQAPYEQLRSLSAHASDGDVWRCEPLRVGLETSNKA
jgi:hypothetical protein